MVFVDSQHAMRESEDKALNLWAVLRNNRTSAHLNRTDRHYTSLWHNIRHGFLKSNEDADCRLPSLIHSLHKNRSLPTIVTCFSFKFNISNFYQIFSRVHIVNVSIFKQWEVLICFPIWQVRTLPPFQYLITGKEYFLCLQTSGGWASSEVHLRFFQTMLCNEIMMWIQHACLLSLIAIGFFWKMLFNLIPSVHIKVLQLLRLSGRGLLL